MNEATFRLIEKNIDDNKTVEEHFMVSALKMKTRVKSTRWLR
jgi:hypothetical protein